MSVYLLFRISSPYLRQHVILSKNNHQYKSGAQYRVDDITRYKDARIRTFSLSCKTKLVQKMASD